MKTVKKSVPRNRMADDGRQQIADAVRARFFSRGLRSVTMDDLAEKIGVCKKTLYAHLPGKTALLEAGQKRTKT